MGCHFLLQGFFPTRGLNPNPPCPQHCRWIAYLLSHREAPESPFLASVAESPHRSRAGEPGSRGDIGGAGRNVALWDVPGLSSSPHPMEVAVSLFPDFQGTRQKNWPFCPLTSADQALSIMCCPCLQTLDHHCPSPGWGPRSVTHLLHRRLLLFALSLPCDPRLDSCRACTDACEGERHPAPSLLGLSDVPRCHD